jgi:hypothetical protein
LIGTSEEGATNFTAKKQSEDKEKLSHFQVKAESVKR